MSATHLDFPLLREPGVFALLMNVERPQLRFEILGADGHLSLLLDVVAPPSSYFDLLGKMRPVFCLVNSDRDDAVLLLYLDGSPPLNFKTFGLLAAQDILGLDRQLVFDARPVNRLLRTNWPSSVSRSRSAFSSATSDRC